MKYISNLLVVNNDFKVGETYMFVQANVCHLIAVCTFSYRQYANFESKEIPKSSVFYGYFKTGHNFKFKDPCRAFNINQVTPILDVKETSKKTKSKKRASK